MNTSLEGIPQTWDSERDVAFFRVTAAMFTPSFCYGASALLASYDEDLTADEVAPNAASNDSAVTSVDAVVAEPADATPHTA
jgi:hypothetical protein